MYESKKSIKSQPARYMTQFTTFLYLYLDTIYYLYFIPIFEVVNVSRRHRGHFGQEGNDVKLLQLEVF